ncbi:MAG: hypothetical protein HY735_14790 [Verrucomicrobia bacterium]|nr:hypothetical protein [Verrucomicrobiota bacterium]
MEWLDPRTGAYLTANSIAGAARRTFAAPDANDWILHLILPSATRP